MRSCLSEQSVLQLATALCAQTLILASITALPGGCALQKRTCIASTNFAWLLPDNIQRLLSSSSIEFRCSITEEPVYTQIDASRLTVAILNAIHNSCVFSDLNNIITFSLRKQESPLSVTISDKGVGIPAKEPLMYSTHFIQTPRRASPLLYRKWTGAYCCQRGCGGTAASASLQVNLTRVLPFPCGFPLR